MKTNIIYNKSCLSMPEIDNNSVDCIITSPPYWGLRDYGKEVNQIWGGDLECEHQWQIIDVLRKATPGDLPSSKSIIASKRTNAENRPGKPSQFCQLCGAWYGQLGLEPTLALYIKHLLLITAECKRVLKPTGVMWWNHGDCYSNSPSGSLTSTQGTDGLFERRLRSQGAVKKPKMTIPTKSLCMQNYRLILKLIDEQNWILRNTVIWAKPNGMPSSVKDRLANKYEPVFMLVKNKKYWFDLDAIREGYTKPLDRWGGDKLKARGISTWDNGTGQTTYRNRDMRPNKSGKNPGDVWSIPTQPYPEAHFATFPEKLITRPILSSCPDGGIVLDPFAGSGTTLATAHKYHRQYIGYELNPKYLKFINERIAKEDTLFNKGQNGQH